MKRVTTLQYNGTVQEFLRALRVNRMASVGAGTLSADERNRRQFQRRLRQAQVRSRHRLLIGGGEIA